MKFEIDPHTFYACERESPPIYSWDESEYIRMAGK